MIRRLACLAAALTAACGGSSSHDNACDPVAQTGCAFGQFCEPVQNGAPACFAPVLLRGTVSAPGTPAIRLDAARVVALDANRAAVSTVAVSAADGTYELKVRAARDSSGKPVQATVTLRADRQGYQTFPGGPRTALPIDLSGATQSASSWVVSGTLTDLLLLPLQAGGTASIHGTVPVTGVGALVVAEPAPGGTGPQTGVTGVADGRGDYAIFNLTAGQAYVVTAYAKGTNYVPATTAALAAGDNAVAPLQVAAGVGAPLAGSLIFNNSANPAIQVTLTVESTYDPNLDRGESPPGLTVAAGATGYAFAGVPDGKYVVLAAFGPDGDVRDVSGTGNTAAPVVTVLGGAVQGSPPGFKIIPAVNLLTIAGATVAPTPAVVTSAAPTFTWKKGSVDSSALSYRVLVFDAFGNPVWSHDVAASQSNSLTYGGPALQAGMTYQLRILAIKEAMPVPGTFTQLSQTEDVLGVFTYLP